MEFGCWVKMSIFESVDRRGSVDNKLSGINILRSIPCEYKWLFT